jgi:hypothetical protein
MSERHDHCNDHKAECWDSGRWCENCPCRKNDPCHAHVHRNFDKTWIRRRPMVSLADILGRRAPQRRDR